MSWCAASWGALLASSVRIERDCQLANNPAPSPLSAHGPAATSSGVGSGLADAATAANSPTAPRKATLTVATDP